MWPNVISVELKWPCLASSPNVWCTLQAWRMQSGWFCPVFWKHLEVLTCRNLVRIGFKHTMNPSQKFSLTNLLWIFGDFSQNLKFPFWYFRWLFCFPGVQKMWPNVISVKFKSPCSVYSPNVWCTLQAWRMQSGWFCPVFWKHLEVLTCINLVRIGFKHTMKPSQKFSLTNPFWFWWFWPKSEVFALKMTILLPRSVQNVTKCDFSWIKHNLFQL